MVLKDSLTPLVCLAAGYFKAIASIAVQQKAKLYIPVSAPTTAIYDSLTQDVLPKDCMCWTLPPHLTGLLDDKTAFTDLCNKVRHNFHCQNLSKPTCEADHQLQPFWILYHLCVKACILVYESRQGTIDLHETFAVSGDL